MVDVLKTSTGLPTLKFSPDDIERLIEDGFLHPSDRANPGAVTDALMESVHAILGLEAYRPDSAAMTIKCHVQLSDHLIPPSSVY